MENIKKKKGTFMGQDGPKMDLQKTQREIIETDIRKRRLRFNGHVMSLPDRILPKRIAKKHHLLMEQKGYKNLKEIQNWQQSAKKKFKKRKIGL